MRMLACLVLLSLAELGVSSFAPLLDTASLESITSLGVTSVIKVDPRGCERAPGSCGPLNGWWDRTASVWPGRVWRLSCEEQPGICNDLEAQPLPIAHDPLFFFWDNSYNSDSRTLAPELAPALALDGTTRSPFQRYVGPPSPLVLLQKIAERFHPEDVTKARWLHVDERFHNDERFDRRAARRAEAAAKEYLGRRVQLRKAEALLSTDDAANHRSATAILERYLLKWPDHMNAITMAANAARAVNDRVAALALSRRALALEPANARLHAGVAADLMALGPTRAREAAVHLEHALAAPVAAPVGTSTHDAESGEEERAVLRRMLAMCRGGGGDGEL